MDMMEPEARPAATVGVDRDDEEWHAALPRCDYLDGRSLAIVSASEIEMPEPGGVAVTDGERTAIYVPSVVADRGRPDGVLRIIRRYTEAGWFCEVNCLWIADGTLDAIYQPVRIVPMSDAPRA